MTTDQTDAPRAAPHPWHDGSSNPGYSFPSGHATVTFAAATVLQQHLGWKAAVPTYLVATYVAMSRLHDNRHFASDVVFGATDGVIIGRSVTWHGRNFYAMPTIVPGGAGMMVSLGPYAQPHQYSRARAGSELGLDSRSQGGWSDKVWSGCRDSNPGPPAPQAGALARLRYIPIVLTTDAAQAYEARRRLPDDVLAEAFDERRDGGALFGATRVRDLNGIDGGTSCSSGVSPRPLSRLRSRMMASRPVLT